MKLQISTQYALIAVMELTARPDVPVSASEIAARHDLPLSHLAKVLRELGRASVVEAMRGLGGGYRLASPERPLTLYDIVAIFEPHTGGAFTGSETGALASVFTEICDVQHAILASTTFRTLVRLSDMGEAQPEGA